MFSLGMNVWKMRIKNLWRSSKCASPCFACFKKCIAIYESQEKLQPLRYARLNNAHHGFTKALKICISFLWVFQKCASRFLQAIKNADVLYERFNNMHHVFTKALKNAHLLFMCLSKFRIMIYEGHKKCFSFVWALQQCATRFYEGLKNVHLLFSVSFKNLHHNLWRSQKLHLLCTALQ